jgi:hypothetical protein
VGHDLERESRGRKRGGRKRTGTSDERVEVGDAWTSDEGTIPYEAKLDECDAVDAILMRWRARRTNPREDGEERCCKASATSAVAHGEPIAAGECCVALAVH